MGRPELSFYILSHPRFVAAIDTMCESIDKEYGIRPDDYEYIVGVLVAAIEPVARRIGEQD